MVKIFFLLLFLILNNAFGTETVSHIQHTKEFDTLNDVAKRYFNTVKKRYNGKIEDYKKDLIKWNTHITNWKSLTRSVPLFIDTPTEAEKKFEAIKRDWSFFLVYTASIGIFTETTQNQSITNTQNSPISLGLSTYYNIKNRKHTMVSSLYISKLTASTVNGDVTNASQSVPIPMEIGVNIYYQYTHTYEYPTYYAGFDREVFTSYNTKEISQSDPLVTRQNVLYFATLGVTKSFTFYKTTMSVRASIARNFVSTSSSGNPSDAFNGMRYLLYLSLKGKHNLSYNLLYKRFSFKGPTDLTLNRIGLGVGWQFY